MKNFKFKTVFLGFLLIMANLSVADKDHKAISRLVCYKTVVSKCSAACSSYCTRVNQDASARRECVSRNCNVRRFCNIALMNKNKNHPGSLTTQQKLSDIPSELRKFAKEYKACMKEELEEGPNN